VDELLDTAAASGRLDVIGEFAYPLPARVISELLGLPTDHIAQFKSWSDGIVGFIGAGKANAEKAEQGHESMRLLTQ